MMTLSDLLASADTETSGSELSALRDLLAQRMQRPAPQPRQARAPVSRPLTPQEEESFHRSQAYARILQDATKHLMTSGSIGVSVRNDDPIYGGDMKAGKFNNAGLQGRLEAEMARMKMNRGGGSFGGSGGFGGGGGLGAAFPSGLSIMGRY